MNMQNDEITRAADEETTQDEVPITEKVPEDEESRISQENDKHANEGGEGSSILGDKTVADESNDKTVADGDALQGGGEEEAPKINHYDTDWSEVLLGIYNKKKEGCSFHPDTRLRTAIADIFKQAGVNIIFEEFEANGVTRLEKVQIVQDDVDDLSKLQSSIKTKGFILHLSGNGAVQNTKVKLNKTTDGMKASHALIGLHELYLVNCEDTDGRIVPEQQVQAGEKSFCTVMAVEGIICYVQVAEAGLCAHRDLKSYGNAAIPIEVRVDIVLQNCICAVKKNWFHFDLSDAQDLTHENIFSVPGLDPGYAGSFARDCVWLKNLKTRIVQPFQEWVESLDEEPEEDPAQVAETFINVFTHTTSELSEHVASQVLKGVHDKFLEEPERFFCYVCKLTTFADVASHFWEPTLLLDTTSPRWNTTDFFKPEGFFEFVKNYKPPKPKQMCPVGRIGQEEMLGYWLDDLFLKSNIHDINTSAIEFSTLPVFRSGVTATALKGQLQRTKGQLATKNEVQLSARDSPLCMKILVLLCLAAMIEVSEAEIKKLSLNTWVQGIFDAMIKKGLQGRLERWPVYAVLLEKYPKVMKRKRTNEPPVGEEDDPPNNLTNQRPRNDNNNAGPSNDNTIPDVPGGPGTQNEQVRVVDKETKAKVSMLQKTCDELAFEVEQLKMDMKDMQKAQEQGMSAGRSAAGTFSEEEKREHDLLTTQILMDLVKDEESMRTVWARLRAGKISKQRVKVLLKFCRHVSKNVLKELVDEDSDDE